MYEIKWDRYWRRTGGGNFGDDWMAKKASDMLGALWTLSSS